MGKQIKVCMIAYSLYTSDARIKSYEKILTNHGFRVDLLILKEKDKPKVQINDHSRLYRLAGKYRGSNSILYILSYIHFFFASFVKLSYMFLKDRYSVIHVHNMPNFLVFVAILPKLLGAKVILDIHDLMIPIYMAKFNVEEHYLGSRFLAWEQKISANFASHVICADHLQKEMLSKKFRIPDDKITVLMNLPHEDIFKRIPMEKDPETFNLIYHGTIAKRLGIDIMLRAVSQIKDKIPVKLSVYGVGDFLNDVIALQRKLRLENIVYISGTAVPTEKLSEIICRMDVGIIANRRNMATEKYMMPVKLMEYAYLKIPVIAPRLKIIQNYFDENMVKYFDPESVDDLAKCILELYHDKDGRVRFAENAVKFFDVHNSERKKADYIDIISNYLNNNTITENR